MTPERIAELRLKIGFGYPQHFRTVAQRCHDAARDMAASHSDAVNGMCNALDYARDTLKDGIEVVSALSEALDAIERMKRQAELWREADRWETHGHFDRCADEFDAALAGGPEWMPINGLTGAPEPAAAD